MDRPDGHPAARRRVSTGASATAGAKLHELASRCTFPPRGTPIACAVSGGADSLALLVLAVVAGCEVTALHVDHGLRAGSDREAQLVETAAAKLGASFVSLRVDVGAGPNLEARARQARKAALPVGASTGHTMDDQAETVLIRLLRGTGPAGLAAMRTGYEHPLLDLRRSETCEITAAAGLTCFEDPSNHDPSILRNRVRHELLPLCSEMAGRDLVPLLARLAQLAAEDAELLDAQAECLDPTDARALTEAPVVVARRAVRNWLRGDGPYPPDLAAVERVLAVARGDFPGTEFAPGTRVRRTAGRLRKEPLE